jgi:hypothetical protein
MLFDNYQMTKRVLQTVGLTMATQRWWVLQR